MRIMVVIGVLIFSLSFLHGQQPLTAEDAVNLALKNNYEILVALNDASVDSINNTPGNAGMLPDISINGSNTYSPGNNLKQEYSDGTQYTASGEHTNSLNAGIGLNWTLFDGGKMFVTKRKLTEIQSLGEIQYKNQVLQTVSDVILAYYDVVRQKQQLTSINEVITYNLERVKISQTSFDAGLSPKTNLLQAKIDLNVYQENAIHQQSVILAAKRALNQLIGRAPETPFEVVDSIPLNYVPDKKNIEQKLDSSNTNILAYQKQVEVAKLNVKEMNSLLFPRIKFNMGYGFNQSNNSAGSTLMNQVYGPQIGGSVSIPLYQSGNVIRQIKTAKVQFQSAQYQLDNVKLQMKEQMQNAFTEFENQQQLLQIEKDNALLAKENLEIIIQRLRFGQTTSLEVTQAEANYVESLTRLINFEYNVKAAETKLKQLQAKL